MRLVSRRYMTWARDSDLPRSLFAFVWHWTGRSQIGLIVVACMIVPLTVVPLEIQKRVIDEGIVAQDGPWLVRLLMIYAAVALVHVSILYGFNIWRGIVQEVVARGVRQNVARALPHGQTAGDKTERGTIVSVLTAEAEPIGQFAGEAYALPVVNGGIVIGVVGYMYAIQPVLALVVTALLIPQFILIPWLQTKINRQIKARVRVLRSASEESIDVAEGAEKGQLSYVLRAIRDLFTIRFLFYRIKYSMKYAVLGLHFASVIAVLWIGGLMCLEGTIGIGVLVAFLSGLDRMRVRWKEMVGYFRRMESALVEYDLIRKALVHEDAGERRTTSAMGVA